MLGNATCTCMWGWCNVKNADTDVPLGIHHESQTFLNSLKAVYRGIFIKKERKKVYRGISNKVYRKISNKNV